MMPRVIKFKGNPLTLVGRPIQLEKPAPDFTVISQDLNEVRLSDFGDKLKVITSFPSLDTPVCDMQVKEFNKKALDVSSDVRILGISKDLPFAQKRFCQENEIKHITVLSDYRFSSFGINYGLLIKELNLLARAVLILDKNDIIRYVQIAEELTAPVDYEGAIRNLQKVVNNPDIAVSEGLPLKCKPCVGGILPLPKNETDRLLAQYQGWQLVEDSAKGGSASGGKKIVKEFKFKDFLEAKYFLDLVSIIAEEQGHHPAMTIIYNKLKVSLYTHAAGGLTENDFIMAKIIDELEA